MRAYILDDEPLAVTRLRGLLEKTGRVAIVGSSSTPADAVAQIGQLRPDVLFLDIQMPGLSGFDVLERLEAPQPFVVFTTAYDEFALQAFAVNSIDYLMKPIAAAELARALSKLERVIGEPRADASALLAHVRQLLDRQEPEYPERLASRVGDRLEFVDIANVEYFYARDKLTFAATASKHYAVDESIAQLEGRVPPRRWVRIHRAALVSVDAIRDLRAAPGGQLLLRLKDGKTELQVARDRAAQVRVKLGL